MNGPGRPSVITPATDHQLLLTDDGNGALSALGPSPGNEGSACKPSNYADILIPSTAMITVGARYPDIQGMDYLADLQGIVWMILHILNWNS